MKTIEESSKQCELDCSMSNIWITRKSRDNSLNSLLRVLLGIENKFPLYFKYFLTETEIALEDELFMLSGHGRLRDWSGNRNKFSLNYLRENFPIFSRTEILRVVF